MRFELPVLTRCCFCVPLRRGMIFWAYANLAYQSLLMYVNVHILIIMIVFVDVVGVGEIIWEMVGFVLILFSAVYSILILVACHKKSAKLLRISYKYGIFKAIFTIIYSMSSLHREIHLVYIRRMFGSSSVSLFMDMAMMLAGNFLDIILLCYVILLLRSEMIKLQEQSLDFEFVNNAAESEARCVLTQRSDYDIEAKNVSAVRGADDNSGERCVSAQKSANDNCEALCDSEAKCDSEAQWDSEAQCDSEAKCDSV